jgi:hypothetical protein
MRPRFLRWLRAQFLSVGLGFLCRLIRVFADLGDTLAGRLDINDKAFLVGRADDPPIRKSRGSPREATRNDEADHYSSAHLAPSPAARMAPIPPTLLRIQDGLRRIR